MNEQASSNSEIETLKKETIAANERAAAWQKRALEAERIVREELNQSSALSLFLSGVSLGALAWFVGVIVARLWPFAWGQHVMGAVAGAILLAFTARALGRMGRSVVRIPPQN
jgi:membrane associated rhomboid family serine protease